MCSQILDNADFREHVAELGILHVEHDNRLPNGWDIVAKLFQGTLRLVPSEEHEVGADPQNAPVVLHAQRAMRVRGRSEQNRGEKPRG
jgi:hypothetical protein